MHAFRTRKKKKTKHDKNTSRKQIHVEVFCVERPEMDGEMTVSHCKRVAVVSDHLFGTVMWDLSSKSDNNSMYLSCLPCNATLSGYE